MMIFHSTAFQSGSCIGTPSDPFLICLVSRMVLMSRRYVVSRFCSDSVLIIMRQAQHDEEGTSLNQPHLRRSVPDLESLLRERLQKKAGDEEVQDLARAILRHLTSVTGVSCPAAAVSSPEVSLHSVFLNV